MSFDITRRDFLRTASIAGISAAAVGRVIAEEAAPDDVNEQSADKQKPKVPQVPRRTLGKTGITVPIVSLGAMYNVVDNQIGLRKCLAHNANYWDTAHSYANGNSEIGIGKYLEKNPEKRKEVIIATKASGAKSIEEVEKKLQTSFERMHTDYIDIYYGVHALKTPDQLTPELKQWAADAKKRGVIKHFGFTTHTSMTENLNAAAELDWIDVIMTSFNFRLMQDEAFMAAVDKCHKAGIGLVAMKVMASGQDFESEKDNAMGKHFLAKGMTPGQAKIKIVLDDPRIASACVGMDTMDKLNQNIKIGLDEAKLSALDKDVFKSYAKNTCSGYCAACGKCGINSQMPYTPEIMRYSMYYNSYTGQGDKQMARELYAKIPESYRSCITAFDYSKAEKMCPQGIKISKIVEMAASQLA